MTFYGVPAERERLVAAAFPANDDRAKLRAMIDAQVDGDTMGVNARRDGRYGAVRLSRGGAGGGQVGASPLRV